MFKTYKQTVTTSKIVKLNNLREKVYFLPSLSNSIFKFKIGLYKKKDFYSHRQTKLNFRAFIFSNELVQVKKESKVKDYSYTVKKVKIFYNFFLHKISEIEVKKKLNNIFRILTRKLFSLKEYK